MSWFKIKNFIRFYLLAFIATFFFLSFTFLAFWEVFERVQERNQNLFELRSENAVAAIEKRMQDYIQILKGVQSMYKVNDSISLEEWKRYVQYLEVDKNYPGIQGIGFASFLSQEELMGFERKVRASEYPDFNVWPEGERPYYSAILYLEPLDFRNQRALGFDMFSDSVRREAMEMARDTGEPALSGMVKLVQETNVGVQNGFLLYLPVYAKDKPQPLGVEARRASIIGFAYSPFRVNDLLNGVMGGRFNELDIEIYDGAEINETTLLYDKDLIRSYGSSQQPLSRLYTVEVAGHNWSIYTAALPEFGYETSFPWFILGGGILISGLIFLIMYSAANIQKSNYLNQLITDNASPALFIVDHQGYCTFMNPAAEVLTGFSLDEIQERKLHHFLHYHHPDGALYSVKECPIVHAFETGNSLFKHEDVFIKKSGELFDVSVNAQPVYENGKIVAYLMEVRDISQEKKAEAALRAKNRNLETLNKVGNSLSAELELKKLLQLITDSCTELTQAEFGAFYYNQEDEEKEPFMLYSLSGNDQKSFSHFPLPRKTELLAPTLEGNSIVRSADITLDARFGNNYPNNGMPAGHLPVKSYLAVPVISRSGTAIGGLFFGHSKPAVFDGNDEEVVKGIAAQAAIAIDNSQLFETLNSKNKELIRINNDLDNFVYTASHDLKAPMLNIEGLVLALTNSLKKNEQGKVEKIISMIKISVLKFKETIDSLTEVSKINKNLDAELDKINLEDLLKDIEFMVQDMIEETGAKIEASFDCTDLIFSRANLKSLLLNLITNSIKYRSPNRNPEIIISCKKSNGKMVLTVSDNGLGIPDNQLSKVFVMFKRYHSHVEGTGVGLYLVKRIAENYGGTVKVESEVDKGTTFYIELPEIKATA